MSISLPQIKGIDDMSGAIVKNVILTVQMDESINTLQAVNIQFDLPDFANLPSLYLRKASGNMVTIIEDDDLLQTQCYLNINGLTMFQGDSYFVNVQKKLVEGTHFIETIKIYPESDKIMPVQATLQEYSKLLVMPKSYPIFSSTETTNFFISRLGLDSTNVTLTNPHVSISYSPMKIISVAGSISSFREDDAYLHTTMIA